MRRVAVLTLTLLAATPGRALACLAPARFGGVGLRGDRAAPRPARPRAGARSARHARRPGRQRGHDRVQRPRAAVAPARRGGVLDGVAAPVAAQADGAFTLDDAAGVATLRRAILGWPSTVRPPTHGMRATTSTCSRRQYGAGRSDGRRSNAIRRPTPTVACRHRGRSCWRAGTPPPRPVGFPFPPLRSNCTPAWGTLRYRPLRGGSSCSLGAGAAPACA